MAIETVERKFKFTLTEYEACNLVIALQDYNVISNPMYYLKDEIIEKLGYDPQNNDGY